MPALIARAFTDANVPLAWICSDCDALFNLDHYPAGTRVKRSGLRRVNSEFRKHCKQKHPKAIIIELEMPGTGSYDR